MFAAIRRALSRVRVFTSAPCRHAADGRAAHASSSPPTPTAYRSHDAYMKGRSELSMSKTYAIADLHGRFDLLEMALAQIANHAELPATLVTLGAM